MVPGDQAKVSMLVRVAPEDAFRIFTEEIDAFTRTLAAWWGDLMTAMRMRAED